MLEKSQLIINTTEKKMLFAILEELREIRALLGAGVMQEPETEQIDPVELKRNDILDMIKRLPEKQRPDLWPRLPNTELIKHLRKEGVL